jgi:hypothetical protein
VLELLPDPQPLIAYLQNGGMILLAFAAIAISELCLLFLVILALAQLGATARTKPLLREMRSELRRLNVLIEKATAEEETVVREPLTVPVPPTVVPGPGHHLHGRKPK